MAFLVAIIIFNAIALGIAWSWFLIGGPHFRRGKEFDPMVHGHHVYSVERYLFAGATIVLGISWLIGSVYFLGTRIEDVSYWQMSIHVGLQLVASIALVAAGVGVLRFWNGTKTLYFLSIAALLASVLYAVLVYGPGLQVTMYIYVAGAFILFGICAFIAWVYLLEAFTRSSDEERGSQKR